MNSELTGQLTAAATEAQAVLGETFKYGNGTFTGVFGPARSEEIMMPGGGYRRRVELSLVVTRAQSTFKPETKKTLLRASNNVSYRIERFDNEHDALNWILDIVKLGD